MVAERYPRPQVKVSTMTDICWNFKFGSGWLTALPEHNIEMNKPKSLKLGLLPLVMVFIMNQWPWLYLNSIVYHLWSPYVINLLRDRIIISI